MKLHQTLLVLIALLLGFIIGRGTAPRAAGAHDKAGARSDSSAAASKAASGEGDHEQAASTRSRQREERKASPDKGKRISVPLSSITEDLKKRQFSHRNFESMAESMETALIMLGATDTEREQVKKVIEDATKQVLEAEKSHIKVTKSDTTGVDLDTSAMKEVLPSIIGNTKSGLNQALPPDISEALNASIDWDHFYDSFGNNSTTTSFAIVRNRSGGLSARTRFGTAGMSRGLSPDDFPTDGSAAPVTKFFDARWHHFLDGVQLAPIESDD